MNYEDLYKAGKLPERFYNQLSQESPQERFFKSHKRMYENFLLKGEIEKSISQQIEKILKELFTRV